jgi:hypothetical protein
VSHITETQTANRANLVAKDQERRLDLRPAADRVYFGMPLKARRTAKNWSQTVLDFNRTLASIYSQTNPNFRILVGCHDIPELLIATDERLEFLPVTFDPANLDSDPSAIFSDKGRKLYKTAEQFREEGGTWFMTLDADDIISNRLVEFIITNPNPHGYIARQGFILDQHTMKISKVPDAVIFRWGFDKICGSCVVVKFTDRDIEELKRNITESRFGRYLNTDHTKVWERSLEEGRPFTPFPFSAVTYVVNTGDNHSFVHGPHSFSRQTKLIPSLNARGSAPSSETAQEFALTGSLWPGGRTSRNRPVLHPMDDGFRAGFMGCGGMKCGSTALAAYLNLHPEVGMGVRKELRYFNDDANFGSVKTDVSVYNRQFSFKPTAKIYGEVTPLYIYEPRFLERVKAYNPSIKVIIILRNPVDRAYSHWAMEVRLGRESLPFEEALRFELHRWRTEPARRRIFFSYVTYGFYSEQIRRLWRIFSTEQLFFLQNERLDEDPNGTMARVFDFLGVGSFNVEQPIKARVGQYERGLSLDIRKNLTDLFEHDIRQVEGMLGWDCASWLT